jgi:hypothetical protein
VVSLPVEAYLNMTENNQALTQGASEPTNYFQVQFLTCWLMKSFDAIPRYVVSINLAVKLIKNLM